MRSSAVVPRTQPLLEATLTNLIDLATRRELRDANDAATRGAQQKASRKKEADALLDELRRTARLKRNDRAALVRNLGRSIIQLQTGNRKEIAKRILGIEYWQKRKRYIRFPNDASKKSARHAASGPAFARIIDQIINENAQSCLDHEHATIETVGEVLKGTSFDRSIRPQPIDRRSNAASARDAAMLVRRMERVSAKLADEANLIAYFDLISRYPIRPGLNDPLLTFKPDQGANTVHDWWNRYFTDDEMQTWLPWWAPKCIIGHLYVPFRCKYVDLPEDAVAHIKKVCRGEVSPRTWFWDSDCLDYIDEIITSAECKLRGSYHRLPVWLAALPPSTKPALCLYVSIDARTDEFQINRAVSDKTYYATSTRASHTLCTASESE
jgi:hypothetical protein